MQRFTSKHDTWWSAVDYCDVFISCLDSHSDGTHSLQSLHCWASDVMLYFSKSDEETNSSTSFLMAWKWVFILFSLLLLLLFFCCFLGGGGGWTVHFKVIVLHSWPNIKFNPNPKQFKYYANCAKKIYIIINYPIRLNVNFHFCVNYFEQMHQWADHTYK